MRCPLPSLSIPALSLLPLSSHRVLCALAQSCQGREMGCPWKKGNRCPRCSDTCSEFLSIACIYTKMPCPGGSASQRCLISHRRDSSKAALSPRRARVLTVGQKGIDFRRHIGTSTGAWCINPHCVTETDALLPSGRELSPEQQHLLQISAFAYTACQPNSSQNDSIWLTRVTVITIQDDTFAVCRKPWVKVQLTFKTHQYRQCFAEVKCKANFWMGQLIISILMSKRCAHSLFFHFQVLINRPVIINWNSTFIKKWHFINIKLCYHLTYLLGFH